MFIYSSPLPRILTSSAFIFPVLQNPFGCNQVVRTAEELHANIALLRRVTGQKCLGTTCPVNVKRPNFHLNKSLLNHFHTNHNNTFW